MRLSGSLAALALLVGLLLFPEQGRAQNAPTITGSNSLSFPENTATTMVLATYTATDPEMDPLTPSLGGVDAGDFTLTANSDDTGYELKFMAAPDYELPADLGENNVYEIIVKVADDETPVMTTELPVTVSVTNVNDAPMITTTVTTATSPENRIPPIVDVDVVDVDNDNITWTLDSTDDGALFNISTIGVLSFRNSPNFEMPTDTGDTAMNNTYVVTVRVTDDGAGLLDDTHTIIVTVTNVDEPGTVTITGTLSGGEELTAAVTDIDGAVSGLTWQWARGDSDTGPFSDIGTETSDNRYTSVAADVDKYLQATASYTDPEGSGKTATAVTGQIGAGNSEPEFSAETATRTLPENSGAGVNVVGGTTAATDSDSGDTLTYTLTGTDAGSFDFDSSNGQLKTKTGVSHNFNFEATKNSYSVTVSVHDGKDAAGHTDTTTIDDSIDVTINLTNEDEPGTVTITGTLSGGEELTAAVTDIDGAVSGLTWQWARGDSASGPFSDIGTETSADYTSVAADVAKYLQATASYTDPEGSGKTATAVSSGALEASNSEPAFSAETAIRTLPENSGAGVNVVGGTTAASDSDNDTLIYSLSGTDAGSFDFDSSNGQLKTKTGVSHNFNFEATKNSYSVTVSVHDGKDAAGNTDTTTIDATITVTINLTNVNEAPVITTDSGTFAAFTVDENTETSVVIKTYTATDVDASTTLTWSLEGNDAGGFAITKNAQGHGELKFASVPNFEMAADADTMNDYDIRVKVKDNGIPGNRGASNQLDHTVSVTVEVEDVNEAPTITSGPTAMSVPENSTAVGAYTASDVDDSDTQTWSVEPADDGGFFQINSSGELSFKNAPDFEMPADANGNNVYDVTVKVTDSGGLNGTEQVAVTVMNVNEAPVFDEDSSLTQQVDENTAVSVNIEPYIAEDQDADTDFAWSLEGDDSSQFTIRDNSNDWGVVRFLNSPNYEAPTDMDKDNFYKITYKVQDNHTPQMEATFDVIIEVRDVNERPVVSGDNSPDFPEIEFDADDADLSPADFEIGAYTAYDDDGHDVITWDVSGADAEHFTIDSTSGVLSFSIRPDREKPVDMGSNNVYRVMVEADDGQGKSNSVGALTVIVTVDNVDETPEITTTGPTYATPSFDEIEYDATTADLAVAGYAARDEEDETVTWSLGGSDAGDLTIDSGTGVLSFRNPPNFEEPTGTPATPGDDPDNSYEIVVKATDAATEPDNTARNTREFGVTVTVKDIDETPEVTGPDDNPDFPETPYDSPTPTPDVATFSARDEEMQNITWSLGGDDGEDFTITKDPNSGAGVLTFNDPPDYEDPVDAHSLNTYDIIVQASDGTNTGTWNYAVTVTDVNERPEFTGAPETSFTLDEHDANEVYTTPPLGSYSARDEEGGVTWSLMGADSDDFEISGGVVTFANAPSFEAPTDFEGDNIYMFTVVATDVESGTSRLSASVEVTVTVLDIEEDGMITVENLIPQLGADCDRTNLSDPDDGCVVFTLTDPDGGVSFGGTDRWDLQIRPQGGTAPWASAQWGVPSIATFVYAPHELHVDRELRAVAWYTDGRGSGKYAESEGTAPIAPDRLPNVPPVFHNAAYPSIPEGPAGRLLVTLVGNDRDRDTLTYGIVAGERDAELFEVDPTSGQITVLELDFERAGPGEPVRPLTFIATLHDGKRVDADNNVVDDDTVDVTLLMTVTVDDVEEEGVVTLSDYEPSVDSTVEATLTDGDGRVQSARWQWARSRDGSTTWVNISGATAESYTTVPSDEDFFLRARVTYSDNRSTGKSAEVVTSAPVPRENRRPLFPSSEDGQRTVPENTRAGLNVGPPVAAEDPERDRLTYSLGGRDATAFTIATRTGQIRTREELDFETQPSYSVTVEVHDGRDRLGNTSTTIDDEQTVMITIENVDEPGEVTLVTATETIQARVEVTAELEDDDIPTRPNWQWSRSPNGRTGWVNILNATSATYTPTLEEDAGNYIRATATYTDGHGPNKTASAVSPRVGDPPPVNSAPAFPATENGQREAPEDTAAGQIFGDPVVANDLNDDDLTYSLSGPDAASFEIDANSGQLRLASNAQLDFEAKRTHRFTVQVTDGVDQNNDPDDVIDDTVDVVITVTDVNEAPVVTGETSPSFQENASAAVATFTGVDPEGDPFLWSVDNGDFWISSGGQLNFRTPPSFEDQTSYRVTVEATDDGGLAATLAVSVSVTDMEEEGVVTVTPPRGWAGVATQFSADLTDDDGGEINITWRWARSPNGRSGWVDIAGATSSSYTAGADDDGYYLRATAFYEDRRGSNKTAQSAPTERIEDLRPATNSAPAFDDDMVTRSIGQGTAAGRAIGAPVTATDPDQGDILTYSLTGTDAEAFEIDAATGQIRTKAVLDPQVKRIYAVTVSVHDGFDASHNPSDAEDDSTVVTITVTEVSTPVFGGGGGGGGGGPSGPSPSVVDFKWTVKHDLEALDESNGMPTGLWGRDGTLWVAQNGDGANDGVYAYDLESGERLDEREFELDERNRAPRGIWSEGETAWVSDSGQDKLFAYDLASGERLPDRDIEFDARNRDARAIWSDGANMWVLDGRRDALFAYDLATGRFLAEYALDSTNGDPRGLWSDGVAIWVSDHGDKRLFAYRLPMLPAAEEDAQEEASALERVRDEEFGELTRASNNSPRGIWADGDVMYVADESDGRVYTYNIPDAIDARLASLTLSGVEFGEFDPSRTDYEGILGEGVTVTTVEVAAMQRRTDVDIDPPDSDGEADGHQVALEGVEEITVTVTSADGSRRRVYRLRLGEEETVGPSTSCPRGDIAEGFSLVVYEGGTVEELVACAESRDVVALYALHQGIYISYILGAPDFVNAGFRELYADGVPPLTALIAGSNGPPSEDPVGDTGAPRSWPECLRGEITEGFSLVVYEGGSRENLAACAQSRGVTALHALAGGEWMSYTLGAPEFVNRAFFELFPEGLPAITPLVAKGPVPAADASQAGAASR